MSRQWHREAISNFLVVEGKIRRVIYSSGPWGVGRLCSVALADSLGLAPLTFGIARLELRLEIAALPPRRLHDVDSVNENLRHPESCSFLSKFGGNILRTEGFQPMKW
ncbi:hypothetical protein VFPPC_16302 [Pochonia chlamydosporia 170]|uniref:Uncharacterized protein n=1 Tax=Pochonia chlamydosporia 170 TaxID=1380566 RepID=A0A179FHM4_METCM|nr:hypothetical protein VFPPC_16302 [Pochonia chlamydosporia 170]OAQ65056.1 hypothetical protein VFPPC_16302 [Pochonia chlamydosporia 170]